MNKTAKINYRSHIFSMETHGKMDKYISEHLLNGNVWEPALTDVWYNHINEGDLVLDIGANLGWYTKIANLKGANCISVEPDPKHFSLLKINCSEKNELHNICAGADTSDIMLNLSEENFGDNRTSISGNIICKQNSIDNLVGDRANKIRAIKIDTQGWEPNILLGALQTLKNVSDDCLLIIEYWPFGLNENNFKEESYKILFDIFKGRPYYLPQNLSWNECKNNPHIHSDIIIYKNSNMSYKNKNNFDELQTTWNNFGKSEPFWSVLTHENFKKQNVNKETLDEFYNSGLINYNIFEEILNKYNYTFKDKIVLDFGCGVGRMTKACNETALQVYGMDISNSHLEIAKQYDTKSQFFLVDNLETLPELPKKPNIITSLIVLQHSRPDIIKHQVGLLLDILDKDGIALLHIPYDILNYQSINSQVDVMEMHFVPQSEIINIAKLHNCDVLEIVDKDFCGSELIKNCVYIIRKIYL